MKQTHKEDMQSFMEETLRNINRFNNRKIQKI